MSTYSISVVGANPHDVHAASGDPVTNDECLHPALLILLTGHTSILESDGLGLAGKTDGAKRWGLDPKPQTGGTHVGEQLPEAT